MDIGLHRPVRLRPHPLHPGRQTRDLNRQPHNRAGTRQHQVVGGDSEQNESDHGEKRGDEQGGTFRARGQ